MCEDQLYTYVYVGNLGIISSDVRQVRSALDSLVVRFNEVWLLTREEEADACLAELLGVELDVPVVETDRPQQEEEDEREAETEASLVLMNQAVTVVIVVGVPTPVENNDTQGTCEEQYDEQPGEK